MAIKIQIYSYLCYHSERVEIPEDLEMEPDYNLNNKKLITKNIINISFFAIIGILIAICIISNLKYNKPSNCITANLKYNKSSNDLFPLIEIKVPEKFSDELRLDSINTTFIQRKTIYCTFCIFESLDNETGEFKIDNSLKMGENQFNSSKNDN